MSEHAAFILISMVTFAILLRRFGLETVGLWTLGTALLNYGRIGDVWSKGLLSFIGEARGRGARSEAASYASTTITTGAVGYLFLMCMSGLAVFSFTPHLVEPEQIELFQGSLPFMISAYWLIACSETFSLAFVGFGFLWLRALQRVGGSLLFLLGVLAVDPTQELTGILTIQFAQGAAMLTFGIVAFYGFIAREMRYLLWDFQKFLQLFRFGGKLFFVGSIQLATEPMTKVLVSQFGGLESVAVLELVMRLIQGFRGLIISVGQVLVTSFARRNSGHLKADGTRLHDDFVQATQLFLGGSLVAFSLLFSAGPLTSLVFLNAETQARIDVSFQAMLWVFGTAWFTNTVASTGYFLLMSLRASRKLFFSVLIRAGLIAFLGFPLGAAFGLEGVMAAVLLAFVLSSAYLFATACAAIHLPFSQVMPKLLKRDPVFFLPFAWATMLTIFWIVSPSVSDRPLILVSYLLGFLSTCLLVMRYSRLHFLLRTVLELRP